MHSVEALVQGAAVAGMALADAVASTMSARVRALVMLSLPWVMPGKIVASGGHGARHEWAIFSVSSAAKTDDTWRQQKNAKGRKRHGEPRPGRWHRSKNWHRSKTIPRHQRADARR